MIGILIFVGLVLTFMLISVFAEMRGYNKGRCRKCGAALHQFDLDSQGGRGYCCPKCNHTEWVSWWFVDKKHKEDKT